MHLPAPLRAAVGLIATAADEAKHLPDRAIELPMLAVSSALQMSLRAQQRYARLAERGDAVLNRREVSDEPPGWATFDDFPGEPSADAPVLGSDAARASRLIGDLFGTDTPKLNGVEVTGATRDQPTSDQPVADQPAVKTTPVGTAPAKKASKQTTATKTTAKKAAKRATADKADSSASRTTAKKTPPVATATSNGTDSGRSGSGSGKAVRKPRTGAPSRFDNVEDD